MLSCSKESLSNSAQLTGIWIESDMRKDTITFQQIDGSGFFTLSRGYDLQNGVRLPKYGSGIYSYRIKEDHIELKWLLSSNSDYNPYLFLQNGNRIRIGNFFHASLGPVLEFRKQSN
jgi:hypothetical protein